METTRHFTATTYVVHDGATLLHEHRRIGKWLPPGGHVDRDELPHEAARREVAEETGLDVTIIADTDSEALASPTVEPLPQPRHVQLADVNVCDGEVGHQHVDLVYYATAPDRDLDPDDGEVPDGAWEWFDAAGIRAATDRLDRDVREIARRAIETVESRQPDPPG